MSAYPEPCACPDESCQVIAFKTLRNGHAKGCTCPECKARGSQRSGARGDRRRHKRLSSARVPVDESAHGYPIRVSTQDKVGKQVPESIRSFLGSKWFGRALKQASDKIPFAAVTFPAVYLEVEERAFLIVDVTHEFKGVKTLWKT